MRKQITTRIGIGFVSWLLFLGFALSAQSNQSARTRVIVLGVDHAAQLVSHENRPAVLSAFIESLRPSAICIERPPEQAQRRDFYEFTYEVQDVVLPLLAAHPAELCPVDWMPPVDDQKLVFGRDLDVPPEVRPKDGFLSFLTFPDPQALKRDIFFAEDPAAMNRVRTWSTSPATRVDQDYPRRLYLYRTFMQAQRIRAAAATHRGQTVLVVIGYFHKPDLEAILSHDDQVELIQPSAIGRPTLESIGRATTRSMNVAVLSFNLLGRQANTGNVDWTWVEQTLRELETNGPDAESRLFRARFNELTQKTSTRQTMDAYRELAHSSPAVPFTWTGVKDGARVDSYFDPFGNLLVRQRAVVELARLLLKTGAADEANHLLAELSAELGVRKARQLDAYAMDYLRPNK